MKTSRFFLILFLLTVLLLGGSKAALAAPAIPPTPSSFYGEIHFQSGDGEPAEGAYVEAYVPGVSGYVARDALTTNNENLVYAMNIPGDDSYTAEKDGGLSGDTITFKIGGRIVATSTWAAGTDVRQHIHPPKASAGDYYSVKVSEAVQVIGSASDWLAGEILNYAWDLDDDGSFDDSTAQAPSYTFTTTGTKTVHLKVTDSKGGEGISSAKVFVYTLGGTTGQTYDGTAHTITMSGIEAPYSYIIYYGTLMVQILSRKSVIRWRSIPGQSRCRQTTNPSSWVRRIQR